MLFIVVGKAAYHPPRLWPRPTSLVINSPDFYTIDPCAFSFDLGQGWGVEAADALAIYSPLIFPQSTRCARLKRTDKGDETTLHALTLHFLKGPASHEAYSLTIGLGAHGQPEATLSASSRLGLLRGLETFSQLITTVKGGCGLNPPLLQVAAGLTLHDEPSFAHRGVLVDCARNFMPVDALKRVVDGLMASKMNRLHLHLTDSQSFPLELTTGHGPNITKHGAYSETETYSVADMADLQAYASARGVELLPELDTPGHSRAIGSAPGLAGIVSCADVPGANYTSCCNEPPCGQLNPASELSETLGS